MFIDVCINICMHLITPYYIHLIEPQCSENFLTPQVLKQKTLDVNIYDVLRRDQEQRVFPDITFTCSGTINKWILGGKATSKIGVELQIWRRNSNGVNNYTKVAYSILQASNVNIDTTSSNVYEHTANPPLAFQSGDILGVYQRSGGSRTSVYYQETTGPTNYHLSSKLNIDPPVPNILNNAVLVSDQYDYPLVTVEISELMNMNASFIMYDCFKL